MLSPNMSKLVIFFGIFCISVMGFIAPRSLKKARFVDPVLTNDKNDTYTIPHSFIVQFHPNHSIEDHFANIGHNFSSANNNTDKPVLHFEPFRYTSGYFATIFNHTFLHEVIRHDPGVLSVTCDFIIRMRVANTSEFLNPSVDSALEKINIKSSPKKGGVLKKRDWKGWIWQDRVQTNWWMANNNFETTHPQTLSAAGTGTLVYIMDTAIIPQLAPGGFRNEITYLKANSLADLSPYCQLSDDQKIHSFTEAYGDGNNVHGTAIGVVIGDSRYGVAPQVTIKSIKVFCSYLEHRDHPSWPKEFSHFTAEEALTSIKSILKAFEDIYGDYMLFRHLFQSNQMAKLPSAYYGAVVILGVSVQGAQRMDSFVKIFEKLRACGILVVAGAGDNSIWAESGESGAIFPANYADDGVYIVGAYDQRESPRKRLPSSNWGSAVSIWAPGHSVMGITDSSIAASQVAGWAALVQSVEIESLGYPMNIERLVKIIFQNAIHNMILDVWPNFDRVKGNKFDTGFDHRVAGQAPYKGSIKYALN